MPFAFLIIGAVLTVAGVRDKASDLWELVKGDFSGDVSYTRWLVAILIIGSIGYIQKVQPLSRALMTLLLLVLFLTKGNPNSASGGFFQKFNQDLFNNKLGA